MASGDFSVSPFVTVVLKRSMNSGIALLVDAPHGVHGERDLQVVAAEHRVVAGELLGVRVRRDADVGDVEQPAAAGGRRPSLHAVEAALAEDRALGEIADVAGGRVGVARARQPDERAERRRRQSARTERCGTRGREATAATAVRVQTMQHGRPPHADEVS